MKKRSDLIRSWIRKAESDLTALELILSAEKALDVACFHAQQAAEKYLKAYLVWADLEFPYVHDISKLIHLCATKDPRFAELEDSASRLTPYAVELRYDDEFWPNVQVVRSARETALNVKALVLARLPKEFQSKSRKQSRSGS